MWRQRCNGCSESSRSTEQTLHRRAPLRSACSAHVAELRHPKHMWRPSSSIVYPRPQIEPENPHEMITSIRPRRSAASAHRGRGSRGVRTVWHSTRAILSGLSQGLKQSKNMFQTCAFWDDASRRIIDVKGDACARRASAQSSPCMHERVSLFQSMLPVHEITSHLTPDSTTSTCSPRPAQARPHGLYDARPGAARDGRE